MPKKAVFLGKALHELTTPIKLIYIINMDQVYQGDDCFKLFLQMVNKHKHKINHLVILDTSYLHRHYNRELSDAKIESPWLATHKAHFSLIDESIKYEVMTWDAITNDTQFASAHTKVLQDYQGNESGENIDSTFHQIVQNLVFKYKHKKTKKEALQYVLEECAGSLILDGSYVTYPGHFNAAISYVVKKYQKGPQLIPYRFKGKEAIEQPITKPFGTAFLQEVKLVNHPLKEFKLCSSQEPQLKKSRDEAYEHKMLKTILTPSPPPQALLVVEKAKETWSNMVKDFALSAQEYKPAAVSLFTEMLFRITQTEIAIKSQYEPVQSDLLKPVPQPSVFSGLDLPSLASGNPPKPRMGRSASDGEIEKSLLRPKGLPTTVI